MILEAFSYQGVEVGGFERAKEVRNVVTGKDWSTTEHLRANMEKGNYPVTDKCCFCNDKLGYLVGNGVFLSHQSDEEQVNNVLC